MENNSFDSKEMKFAVRVQFLTILISLPNFLKMIHLDRNNPILLLLIPAMLLIPVLLLVNFSQFIKALSKGGRYMKFYALIYLSGLLVSLINFCVFRTGCRDY